MSLPLLSEAAYHDLGRSAIQGLFATTSSPGPVSRPPTRRIAMPQACEDLATPDDARPPLSPIDPSQFQRRLTVATLGLLLVVLLGFVLYVCASILQPLFIAGLLVYLVLPVHQWLVRWRVPSAVAYVLIVVCVLGLFWGIGQMAYRNFAELSGEQLSVYEERLDNLARKVLRGLPFAVRDPDNWHVRNLLTFDIGPDSRVRNVFRAAVGNFLEFLMATFVVLIYLIFLIAERVSLPGRVARAFGEARAREIMTVVETINRAVHDYIALKTFVSFLQGLLSFVVLAAFGVDFAVMWGVLIFLFNFIPYIGSFVAVSLPIVLSFLQYAEEPWKPLLITLLLLVIQRVVDNFIEPRLTGHKLGLSPLLVLLSLAFWGWLWGAVGMILAVPLTVIGKIILENIREAKPLATLMSME
jgi:predicted PurR-regulated permease PerM